MLPEASVELVNLQEAVLIIIIVFGASPDHVPLHVVLRAQLGQELLINLLQALQEVVFLGLISFVLDGD